MTTLDTTEDEAQIQLLDGLHNFRKQHGNAAYLALLQKFNVQRWGEIPATAYGPALMQCKAGIAGLHIKASASDVERAEGDANSLQARLNDLATKIYGNSGQTRRDGSRKIGALETVIRSGDSLKEGLDMAARAVHLRNRSQA